MIDAFKITDFRRNEHELEEYFLFCLAVAGKKASMISVKLEEFLSRRSAEEGPFDYVLRLASFGVLGDELRRVKMGKYGLLEHAYPASAALFYGRLSSAPVCELETMKGVGPKTARFFALHSRQDAGEIAVIDTHVMKFLRHMGHNVPPRMPDRRTYPRLEQLMLQAARDANMPMPQFDLAVWSHYASNGASPLPT